MADLETFPEAPHGFDGRPAGIPTVSVIIPAFNAEAFIELAIRSAMAQSHRPLEIIIVDDGSQDGTAHVVSNFPVKLIRQVNGGPGSARNTGVLASRGEWLAFLDHDDTWQPDKTERQLALVRPGIDAVFSAKSANVTNIDFERMYWRNLGGNPSSTIIRRQAVINIGMFDDDRALLGLDDYNLWLRFLLAGKRFAISPELYNFTPVSTHYGGNSEMMLAAELVNIDKISKMAGIGKSVSSRRKRNAVLSYMPSLIYGRHIVEARYYLLRIGCGWAAWRYWYVFLPTSTISLKRRLRRMMYRIQSIFSVRA